MKLGDQSVLNKLRKDTIIYFIGKILVGILNIITVSILTRLFDTEKYGNYTLVYTLCNLVIMLIMGWLSEGVIRYYNEYCLKQEEDEFISSIFFLVIIATCSITLLVLMILLFSKKILNRNTYLLYLFGVVSIFPQVLYSLSNSIMRANLFSTRIRKNELIRVSMHIILTVLLSRHFGVSSIFISIIIINSVLVFFNFQTLEISSKLNFKKINLDILKKLLFYGLPLILVNSLEWINSSSDKLVIKLFTDSTKVGLYSANYSIANGILAFIISTFMFSLFPIIVRVWNSKGKKETEILMSRILKYYLILGIPSVIGIISISDSITHLMLPIDYIENGNTILIVTSISIFIMGLSQFTEKAWQLTNKTIMIFKINLTSALINIGLNFLLIPYFGYKMAAITTMISYLVNFSIGYFYLEKY